MNKITNMLFEQRDGASLAVFRIMLGILLLSDVLKKFPTKYIVGDFTPSYYGFDWVQADAFLVSICIGLLPYTVLCITFGLFYRFAMPLTALMVGYLFLAFPEYYLNHYYLLLLYLILMSFLPANKVWSLDALMQKNKEKGDVEASVPQWCYLILKLQTETMLIFAGLVKINPDWFNLMPLTSWVGNSFYDLPVIGWIFLFDAPIAVGAYGVILLHIFGAPLLFWSRARPYVFALYVCFHLTNSTLFNIGIFPYMAIAATLLFFNADWPRYMVEKLSPFMSLICSYFDKVRERFVLPCKVIVLALCLWLFIQVLIPSQALLLSTNRETAWNGHRDLFTWRMMLNDRAIRAAVFVVHVPERRRIEFIPLMQHMNAMQCTRIAWSDMTVQFANYLEGQYRKKYNTEDVAVHAYIAISINMRETEIWADPAKNLAAYDPKYGVHEWLEPFDNPLRTWREYRDAPKYELPTYREILAAMNLPEEEVIVFDESYASLDAYPSKLMCR